MTPVDKEAAAQQLEESLGYVFSQKSLASTSLAHRSWIAEQIVPEGGTKPESNERIEFLGDAVLGMSVTTYIFDRFPSLSEGELAKVRASVVNAGALAEIATELGLGKSLFLGKGEDASGGREKPSILADAMEAVIGAVYLDGGWEPANKLILDLLRDRIEEASKGPGGQDYKTRLQELAARQLDQLPVYRIREEGPDHAKIFCATVSVGDEALGEGEGRSKKQAEQAAAKSAWMSLDAQLRDGEARETVEGGRDA